MASLSLPQGSLGRNPLGRRLECENRFSSMRKNLLLPRKTKRRHHRMYQLSCSLTKPNDVCFSNSTGFGPTSPTPPHLSSGLSLKRQDHIPLADGLTKQTYSACVTMRSHSGSVTKKKWHLTVCPVPSLRHHFSNMAMFLLSRHTFRMAIFHPFPRFWMTHCFDHFKFPSECMKPGRGLFGEYLRSPTARDMLVMTFGTTVETFTRGNGEPASHPIRQPLPLPLNTCPEPTSHRYRRHRLRLPLLLPRDLRIHGHPP